VPVIPVDRWWTRKKLEKYEGARRRGTKSRIRMKIDVPKWIFPISGTY
jgi:hypothetical protein